MIELNKKTLVFGLGTGRCGTTSLAKLLNSQENAFVGHELSPILPWEPNFEMLKYRILQLEHQTHADIIGDVGMYYLPYVESLLRSQINEKFDLKFIILQRNQSDTIESYIKKLNKRFNPFQAHDGTKWERYDWDKSFPKYNTSLSIREACSKYWIDYYCKSRSLVEKFPENIRIFKMTDLNKKNKVLEILSFIGIDSAFDIVGIHINKNG